MGIQQTGRDSMGQPRGIQMHVLASSPHPFNGVIQFSVILVVYYILSVWVFINTIPSKSFAADVMNKKIING